MNYFIVTSTIKDGEYEYMQQSPVEAKDAIQAGNVIAKQNEEWTQDDYREHEIDRVEELTEDEYNVIREYIY